jgi:hypothetical protein
VHRPSSVAAPFGFGPPAPLDLAALAQHLGAELYRDAVSLVDPEHRIVVAAPTHAFGLADGPHARRPPARLTVYGIGAYASLPAKS